MNEKLALYISTLERLQATAEQQDKEALAYAVEKLRDELKRASMELMST